MKFSNMKKIILYNKCILILYIFMINLTHGFILNGTKISIYKNQNTNKDIIHDDSCGIAQNGNYYFPISSQSPKGQINLYYTQFDSNRHLPISTTTYHDSMNHEQIVPRIDDFRKYPCPELPIPTIQSDCSKTYRMTNLQQGISGYTSYDRGHMVPVNPYRFHEQAVSNTFYCINIAPQEPYTNQNPWFTVEDKIHRRTTAGYVMTGLCESNSIDGVTLDGVQVPSCFWKLLCYKLNNKTHVVGFIGENKLFNRTDDIAKEKRKLDTIKPRSQQEIINRNNQLEIFNAWISASEYLLDNRESTLAPNPIDCWKQKILDPDIEDEWARTMMEEEEYTY